jgi:hypothetical protein
MRRTPQFEKNYSSILNILTLVVKMFLTRGQYAWAKFRNISLIQKEIFLTQLRFNSNFAHQRLNVEQAYNQWFQQWLVGFTDGDGTFALTRELDKWSLTFKIGQNTYNLRALYYIKKQLGVGSVYIESNKDAAHFIIRDRKVFNAVIFPIFDQYPLLTTKYFNYIIFKEAYNILENPNLTKTEKDDLIEVLLQKKPSQSYVSPTWNQVSLPLSDANEAKKVISKPWLIGFIEAEGSFYLVSKDSNRIVHGFGISQKLDKVVLEGIRHILHIPTTVVFKSKHNYYMLNTTNSRAISNVVSYFNSMMRGMKAVEFRIWSRTFNNNKGDFNKLVIVRERLRSLRSIKSNPSLWKS